MKRFLSVLLSLCMALSMLGGIVFSAHAEEPTEQYYDFESGLGGLQVENGYSAVTTANNSQVLYLQSYTGTNPRVTVNTGYVNKQIDLVYYQNGGSFYFYSHLDATNLLYVLTQANSVKAYEGATELASADGAAGNQFNAMRILIVNGYFCVKSWKYGSAEPTAWNIVSKTTGNLQAASSQFLIDYSGAGAYLDDIRVTPLNTDADVTAALESICGENHTYDNDQDADCNICGHHRDTTPKTITVDFEAGMGAAQAYGGYTTRTPENGGQVLYLASYAASTEQKNPRITIPVGFVNKEIRLVFFQNGGAFYFYPHVMEGEFIYTLTQTGSVQTFEAGTALGNAATVAGGQFNNLRILILDEYFCYKAWKLGTEEPAAWDIVSKTSGNFTAETSSFIIDYSGEGAYLDSIVITPIVTDAEYQAGLEAICGDKHTYDNPLDDECNICHYKRVITHTPGEEWHSDDTNHWHICADEGCDLVIEETVAAHTYEWVVDSDPTKTANGIKHEECTVCHHKRNEGTKIPKLFDPENPIVITDDFVNRNLGVFEIQSGVYDFTTVDKNNITHNILFMGPDTRLMIPTGFIDKLVELTFYNGASNGTFLFFPHADDENYIYSTVDKDAVKVYETGELLTAGASVLPQRFTNLKLLILNGYYCTKVWAEGTPEPEAWNVVAEYTVPLKAENSVMYIDYAGSGCYISGLKITPLTIQESLKNELLAGICGENHTYDDVCDSECNVCHTQRIAPHNPSDEWICDETHHWHVCKNPDCGITLGKTKAAHTCEWVIDQAATTESTGLMHEECTVCHQKRNEGTVIEKHVHTASSDEWLKDDAKHWHVCGDCEAVMDSADHTWDAGTVTKEATADAEGEMTYTCTVCGETKTEVIPKPAQPTDKPTQPTDKPAEQPTNNTNVVVLIIIVLVVIAAVAAAFIVLKKKKQ